MEYNPSKLRPAELVQMLNSFPHFGTVTDNTKIFRHRQQASFRISADGKTVNFFKYLAWLVDERQRILHKPGPRDYEAVKEAARARNAEMSQAGRDIGKIPAVVNPERRARCEASFRVFCETYFPHVFYLPWSVDHDKVIQKIERAVTSGGLFAVAMPRGSGKTVLCQMACLWSALTGATSFVCLVAASSKRAKDLLENIKIWIETNPLLAEDFPEVTFPVRALERIANRQKGQNYNGEPTRIEWASDRVVLPTIEGSQSSGVVISCSGMKGSEIRGQNGSVRFYAHI